MRVQRRGLGGIWGRRVLVVPGLYLVTIAGVVALPLVLLATLAADLIGRRGLRRSRVAVLLVAYALLECWGVFVTFSIWIAAGFGLARRPLRNWSTRFQTAWGAAAFRLCTRVLGVEVVVEDREAVTPGPVIVFMRHTSVVDTLAPAEVVARPCGLALRYVMKRELLWAPGINVMGTRTRNCFVRRGAGGESRFVGMLADDLGPTDGVLIYPEGMVLTPAKAAAAEARRAAKGEGARARPYDRVHAPRLGGPLALLERTAGSVDVVFCAHVGFEIAPGVRQLLRGDLVGARVRMAFWRIPAADLPASRPALADWLHERWHEVDDWVGRAQDELGVRPATH